MPQGMSLHPHYKRVLYKIKTGWRKPARISKKLQRYHQLGSYGTYGVELLPSYFEV
jgi:hypothetical protein